MRYYNLVESEKSPLDVIETLTRDCAPLIQEVGGIEKFLTSRIYRGSIEAGLNETVRVVKCPVNRKPRDTVMSFHLFADEWFYDETGIRFRSNAFFGTGARDVAFGYGSGGVEVVVPIGNFNYCWSGNIHDMTKQIDRFPMLDYEDEEMFINRMLNEGDYRFNTNLLAAIGSQNEIMINCDTAYLINVNYFNYLQEVYFNYK